MNKFKKGLALFAMVLLPLTGLMTACGSDEDSGSLLDNTVYVTNDSLNGGKFTGELAETNSTHRKLHMNLSEKRFNKDIYNLLNQFYSLKPAYEAMPKTDDVVKDGMEFGGWYLDKDCSVGSYLTKNTYLAKHQELNSNKGLPIYARWLEPGTREIVFEVDGKDFTFLDEKPVNNQIRLTYNKQDYDTIEELNQIVLDMPKAKISDELQNDVYSPKFFKKWTVDFNGLPYDYKDFEFLPRINFGDHYQDQSEVNYHNASYKYFFRNDIKKPYMLLRPESMSTYDKECVSFFFNENGGVWNEDYGDRDVCGDRNIDKMTSASDPRYFEHTHYYSFANHGINTKQTEKIYKPGGEPPQPIEIDFLPSVDDVKLEGKVFAGWYLDKECTPGNLLTNKTYAKLYEKRESFGYEVDLYARWIDEGVKEITYENKDGTQERIQVSTASDSKLKDLSNYKIDFNGLLFDYELGSYPNVPKAKLVDVDDIMSERFIEIDQSYYNKFSYENFITNGKSKPYLLLVEK